MTVIEAVIGGACAWVFLLAFAVLARAAVAGPRECGLVRDREDGTS